MGRNENKGDNVNNSSLDLEKYRRFLESIPLDKYREELKDIKYVEQDLPEELFPLHSIFKYYWEERKFLDFDEWFENFWKEINTNPKSKNALANFKKYFFNKSLDENDWFKKGFKARMYRTWISVLTQLDFCYLFEHICAKEGKNLSLECNAESDIKGIDVKVGSVEFQIAKISQRKEARTAGRKKKVITLHYVVWDPDELRKKIQNPRTKKKEAYQRMIEVFERYFIKLRNGFVVFSENYLKPIIDNIDNIEEVRKAIERITSELSGVLNNRT